METTKRNTNNLVWPFGRFVQVVWVILLVIGLVGVWSRLTTGHREANYGSYVTWGLWVAGYIYFIGLSAGAFLISSLVYGLRFTRLKAIGKLALFTATVTLFMALLSIWFDLGHMSRFYYIFLRPNFSSMMAWMVWLYTAYFLLLLTELWFALRPDLVRVVELQPGPKRTAVARILLFGNTNPTDETIERGRRILRRLALIGIPLAIAFHGGVGALFGTIVARPYWHTPLYPILFLTGALVSGSALLTAAVVFFWRSRAETYRETVKLLGTIVLGILAFDVVLEFAEYTIPMWYQIGPEYDLLMGVLTGEFWYVFWIFHILLGTLIPVYLLLRHRNNPKAVGWACALIATTFMAVRLNIVVPGLIEPQLQGLQNSYQDARLLFEYVPSIMEWQVSIFIVALGFGLFYAGSRLLPITRRFDGKQEEL
jgi:Ni/Fe-hydrogenase subunit HybB-like protein